MSDFIRGGQVTFHNFRMFIQVSKILFRISLALILVSIFYCYHRDITPPEWKIGIIWLKKDIYNKYHKVEYLDQSGVMKTIQLKDFGYDPYVLQVMSKFEKTLYKSFIISSVIILIVIGSLLIFFWLKGNLIKRTLLIRGIFLISALKLKSKISQHNKFFKNYKPLEIADFPYPITGRRQSWSSGEQSHTLLIGSTGAGKTKIIQNLVYQLHKRNLKAIIVDIKGDFIKYFYRKHRGDIILNPLDSRGQNWSIFNETNALKGFSTIAKSLLPKDSKNDPIWTEAARAVLAEMASLYVSEGLSLSEFADKLIKSDLETLAKLLEKTSASKIVNVDIEKAALSVLMVLSTYLRPLKLYRSAKDCFSITDWVHDDKQNNFLFISSRADVKEDLNPLISTQVDIAINALRSLKEESNTPKVIFILDEISYFDQSIPSLKDGLTTARSYGGCFVLGTQDMSSLIRIYSRETSETIANNCKTKLFLNVEGKETAEWCSMSIGEGEIEEKHEGQSYGSHEMRDGVQINKTKSIKKAVLSSELMMLKAGEGFIKFAGYEPAKFKFDNCYFKKISSPYEENLKLFEILKNELQDGEKRRKELEMKLSNFKNKEDTNPHKNEIAKLKTRTSQYTKLEF